MRRNNCALPENITYLALGAGAGEAEIELAEELSIPLNRTVLLDRKFKPESKNRLRANYPEVTLLDDTGIFSYLQQPSAKDFALVSIIGVEYLVEDMERLTELISLLPNTLRPGGIVWIWPGLYDASQTPAINSTWRRYGFEQMVEVEPYLDPMCYVYQPQSPNQ